MAPRRTGHGVAPLQGRVAESEIGLRFSERTFCGAARSQYQKRPVIIAERQRNSQSGVTVIAGAGAARGQPRPHSVSHTDGGSAHTRQL